MNILDGFAVVWMWLTYDWKKHRERTARLLATNMPLREVWTPGAVDW